MRLSLEDEMYIRHRCLDGSWDFQSAYVEILLGEIDYLRDLVWRLRSSDESALAESRLVWKWLAPGEGKGDMGG